MKWRIGTRGSDLALIIMMKLKHAVPPLHDLKGRSDCGPFERDVGDLVDRHPRRDFDETGRLILHGLISGRDGLNETGQRRLEDVDIREGSKVDHRIRLDGLQRSRATAEASTGLLAGATGSPAR